MDSCYCRCSSMLDARFLFPNPSMSLYVKQEYLQVCIRCNYMHTFKTISIQTMRYSNEDRERNRVHVAAKTKLLKFYAGRKIPISKPEYVSVCKTRISSSVHSMQLHAYIQNYFHTDNEIFQ